MLDLIPFLGRILPRELLDAEERSGIRNPARRCSPPVPERQHAARPPSEPPRPPRVMTAIGDDAGGRKSLVVGPGGCPWGS